MKEVTQLRVSIARNNFFLIHRRWHTSWSDMSKPVDWTESASSQRRLPCGNLRSGLAFVDAVVADTRTTRHTAYDRHDSIRNRPRTSPGCNDQWN